MLLGEFVLEMAQTRLFLLREEAYEGSPSLAENAIRKLFKQKKLINWERESPGLEIPVSSFLESLVSLYFLIRLDPTVLSEVKKEPLAF